MSIFPINLLEGNGRQKGTISQYLAASYFNLELVGKKLLYQCVVTHVSYHLRPIKTRPQGLGLFVVLVFVQGLYARG